MFAALLVALTSLPPQAAPRAVDLLNLYERGNHAAVVEAFLRVRDVGDLRKDLEKNGPEWTRAGGAGTEPRRRLVAATVALEFARARLDDEWQELRSLVEWGCQAVSRGAPNEAERVWHLAAVALSEGAFDSGVLFKLGGPIKSYGHLAHARKRFPDEPRFVLAERFVVFHPVVAEPSLDAGLEPDADSTTPYTAPAGQILVIGPGRTPDFLATEERARRTRAAAKTRSDTAVKGLRDVFGDPVIGGEAALRAGHILLIGLELEPALEAFHVAIRNGTSPYVKYLAHFFRGRVLERLDRPAEAERAYAAAADTIPLAQSAALARSSLLMRAGRTAEAHALTRASFDAKPRPPDPWRLFPYGDYYRWPALIAELRKTVGP